MTKKTYERIKNLLITSIIVCIVFGGILLINFINDIQHPECISSNPSLLNKIVDYGDKIGVCVCDGDTCLYVCEKMKENYNFTDDCKEVCIPSWCY